VDFRAGDSKEGCRGERLQEARDFLAQAERVLVLSGAGLSAESGLDTFRGAGGHWRRHRAEDLATPEAFARDPDLVWEWYSERRAKALSARPNPAHEALARWQGDLPDGAVTFVTQNVDGLLQRAGAADVLEFHGSLFRVRCSGACPGETEDFRAPFPHPVPCPRCEKPLRPGVVWFGETIPESTLSAALASADAADLVLVVGTSAVVQPAASLAQPALSRGKAVIEVNLEGTPLSAVATVSLLGSAGELIPSLLAS